MNMKKIFKFIYMTIFPSYFENYFKTSIVKKSLDRKFFSYQIYNFRDFSIKGKIDDYPYGGGPGMILKIEPLVKCLINIKKDHPKNYIVLLSPQGKIFNQKDVIFFLDKLSKFENLIFICGHYEEFDNRIDNYIDFKLSIGKFITTGGELPSLIVTDAIIRSIPGVIKKESYENESFNNYELDFDQYTRPREFKGYKVPEILLSGNHKDIFEWRKKNIENKIKKEKNNKKIN